MQEILFLKGGNSGVSLRLNYFLVSSKAWYPQAKREMDGGQKNSGPEKLLQLKQNAN